MNQAMKKVIQDAFARLWRAASSSQETDSLLARAYESARDGERKHRRGVGGRYVGSVDLAAQYFVVKWFFEHSPGEARTVDHWAHLRSDCFYASALKEVLCRQGKQPFTENPVRAIDYSVDFVKASDR